MEEQLPEKDLMTQFYQPKVSDGQKVFAIDIDDDFIQDARSNSSNYMLSPTISIGSLTNIATGTPAYADTKFTQNLGIKNNTFSFCNQQLNSQLQSSFISGLSQNLEQNREEINFIQQQVAQYSLERSAQQLNSDNIEQKKIDELISWAQLLIDLLNKQYSKIDGLGQEVDSQKQELLYTKSQLVDATHECTTYKQTCVEYENQLRFHEENQYKLQKTISNQARELQQFYGTPNQPSAQEEPPILEEQFTFEQQSWQEPQPSVKELQESIKMLESALQTRSVEYANALADNKKLCEHIQQLKQMVTELEDDCEQMDQELYDGQNYLDHLQSTNVILMGEVKRLSQIQNQPADLIINEKIKLLGLNLNESYTTSNQQSHSQMSRSYRRSRNQKSLFSKERLTERSQRKIPLRSNINDDSRISHFTNRNTSQSIIFQRYRRAKKTNSVQMSDIKPVNRSQSASRLLENSNNCSVEFYPEIMSNQQSNALLEFANQSKERRSEILFEGLGESYQSDHVFDQVANKFGSKFKKELFEGLADFTPQNKKKDSENQNNDSFGYPTHKTSTSKKKTTIFGKRSSSIIMTSHSESESEIQINQASYNKKRFRIQSQSIETGKNFDLNEPLIKQIKPDKQIKNPYTTAIQTNNFFSNPQVEQKHARTVLVLNFIVPGSGTILASIRSVNGFDQKHFCFGVLQFGLSFMIVGYIWSVIQGVQIYRKCLSIQAQNQKYK